MKGQIAYRVFDESDRGVTITKLEDFKHYFELTYRCKPHGELTIYKLDNGKWVKQ